MSNYSFHNFMFPFRWHIKQMDNDLFSEQIKLNNINFHADANWERVPVPSDSDECSDLYNERTYFYEFVHDALYDTGTESSLVRHYVRLEPRSGNVRYRIVANGNEYMLRVDAINLNLYSTGVGVLSFYMHNDQYPDPQSVMAINQYGRRVYPPFISDVQHRFEIASSIGFVGLHGNETGYSEDFSRYTYNTPHNTPASFITTMIHEVAPNIIVKPVVDDRMFVLSWYINDEWANVLKNNYPEFLSENRWYEYVFVDKYDDLSCQNKEMQKQLIHDATYQRWQLLGTVYGASRYSMVCLAGSGCPMHILRYFETEYVRMAELVLVQKASLLRFSAEVTNISELRNSRKLPFKVGSLYKEYIRFVNQIHFREVSAQDQGIEMYQKLYGVLAIEKQVEKLDNEIEELHAYVSLCDDRKNTETMSLLTWIATIFAPISLCAGIFGMNHTSAHWYEQWGVQWIAIGVFTVLVIVIVSIIIIIKNSRKQ